jgi:hypothetical protein
MLPVELWAKHRGARVVAHSEYELKRRIGSKINFIEKLMAKVSSLKALVNKDADEESVPKFLSLLKQAHASGES